jgi:hypothetical protein
VVLTGVTSAGDLLRAGAHERPSYVGADLFSLMQAHPAVDPEGRADAAAVTGPRMRCRDSVVELAGPEGAEELRVVTAGGDPLDVLRAACALSWAAADADQTRASRVDHPEVIRALEAATAGAAWAR